MIRIQYEEGEQEVRTYAECGDDDADDLFFDGRLRDVDEQRDNVELPTFAHSHKTTARRKVYRNQYALVEILRDVLLER